MRKIVWVIAAVLLLCTACSPANEKEYIAQLEQRIDELTARLDAAESALASGGELSDAQEAPDEGMGDAQDETVYVTESGKSYHRAECRFAREGGEPISLSEAKAKGYTPCKVCKPPE